MIRVLLVQEDLLVREGLVTWLSQVGDLSVVGQTGRADEALLLAQTLEPSVVLIDLQASSLDSLALVRTLHTCTPTCTIIVLSLYEETNIQTQAREAGAALLVGKQQGGRALLTAIRYITSSEGNTRFAT